MKPVVQTETEPGRGNCLSACLASLLELPVADVPNFTVEADQWGSMQRWLAGRNMFAARFVTDPEFLSLVPEAYCILIGRSPRRQVDHAVVGKVIAGNCEIIHDPYPGGGGLDGGAESVVFLTELDSEVASMFNGS